ncbi:hypothetical protein EDE08_117123 [Bradyrhizobium sp. R2.2-H]|jgi:hypothetical protein|nr:hypothetical protein EDE10_11724 [Bradyrhizobium sp. Y-H1]TCU65940.1 hypothetical protein EDE08_117123 [Bradyrhizobium sp. R2.2-H]
MDRLVVHSSGCAKTSFGGGYQYVLKAIDRYA